MKPPSAPIWLTLLLTGCLASCGSDFIASGVSTGGTGDRVPDLGEDDVSLPNDADLALPNPPIAANQAEQLALFPTDVTWSAPNWRLVQSDQELLILPDLRRKLTTQLGQKSEGMLFNDQVAVVFGTDAQRSYYQVLSVDDDGEPQLSTPVSITGRILQARLQTDLSTDDAVLDLIVEDYTGLNAEIGSYHLRSRLQDGQSVLPAQRTRLASRPLATTAGAFGLAWIGANKGGNQWLYLIECAAATTDCGSPPPIRLSGKLISATSQLRSNNSALLMDSNRIYTQLASNGQSFLAVYELLNGRLRTVDQIRLTGTATPLVTTNSLTAQSKAVLSTRLFLGGGGVRPPVAINTATQPTLLPTNNTWRSLRIQQTDEQVLFYPNTFATNPIHRIATQGKSEGVYATNDLIIALHSDRQDTLSTLITPHNTAANALSTSTSREAGRVEHLRIQNTQGITQIDELITQPLNSDTPAYFARSLVDPITRTKGTPNQHALPYPILASASSDRWMVWLGQDDEGHTWIHPVFCVIDQPTCDHPEPVKLQGQLAANSTTHQLRQDHAAVRILQDRLFINSVENGLHYLDVYALEQGGLALVRRSVLP